MVDKLISEVDTIDEYTQNEDQKRICGVKQNLLPPPVSYQVLKACSHWTPNAHLTGSNLV